MSLTPLQRACRSTIWASSELISSCCLRQSSTFRASSSDKSTTRLLADAETHKSHKCPCAPVIIIVLIDWNKSATYRAHPHTPSSAPALAPHSLTSLLRAQWPAEISCVLLIINYSVTLNWSVESFVSTVQWTKRHCILHHLFSKKSKKFFQIKNKNIIDVCEEIFLSFQCCCIPLIWVCGSPPLNLSVSAAGSHSGWSCWVNWMTRSF